MTTKIIRTLAAVAFTATALTTVAATGSAFAWEGGWGHGRSYHSYGFGRHYSDFRRGYDHRGYDRGDYDRRGYDFRRNGDYRN
jgi:hypothetical protein